MEVKIFPMERSVEILDKESKPSALNLFTCKCPRCRRGDMFEDKNPWYLKKTMKMNKECPVCGQPLNIEVGFYYGTGYVSYGLTVAFSMVSFFAWWLLIGFSLDDNSIYYWFAANAILLIGAQPYFMRVSRTIWLAFFVRYDRNWKLNAPQPLERTNEAQEGNW